MTDQPESLVLEHLRAIRTDMNDLKNSVRDIRARLASIESYIATLHADSTRGAMSIDDLQRRIERIETRLDIRET
jgi:prefoldin subunit 5